MCPVNGLSVIVDNLLLSEFQAINNVAIEVCVRAIALIAQRDIEMEVQHGHISQGRHGGTVTSEILPSTMGRA